MSFTNLSVSGDATINRVICDDLQTNFANINTTDLAISGDIRCNNFSPFTGSSLTFNGMNNTMLGNIILGNGANILGISNSNVSIRNLRAYGNSEIAYAGINKKLDIDLISPQLIRMSFLANGNTTVDVPNAFIEVDSLANNTLINKGLMSIVCGTYQLGTISLPLTTASIFSANTTINGSQQVTGNLNVLQNVFINGNQQLNGTLISNSSLTASGNIQTNGNLIINSDGNILNSLVIRSGFRQAVATPKFVTYDIPITGTHYFWDNVEINDNLIVGGNINCTTLSLTGNVNASAGGQRADFRELSYAILYKNNQRLSYVFNIIDGTSITTGTLVQLGNAASGGTNSITPGQTLNFGTFTNSKLVKFRLVFRINGGVTLTSGARFSVQSSATAIGGYTARAINYVAGVYVTDQSLISEQYYLVTAAQPFIQILYTGTTFNYIAGTIPSANSYYHVEETVPQ